LKLALGPLQYYWPRDTIFRFYDAMATTPVDIVYLGETVCSRRHELRLSDWIAIAASLSNAGKEVLLSTQVLLESKSDLNTMRNIVGNGRFMVEANDFGAVRLLAGSAPFVAGPQLNIYNAGTLQLMADLGARRWVAPLESSRDALGHIVGQQAEIETEVFAYGRMPLAFSARCFTARHHNLPKDNCQFKCLEYPDGLLMKTREAAHFLTLNGIQTQSALVYNLIAEMDGLRELGVAVLRISPQAANTDRIVACFDAARRGERAGASLLQDMESLAPDRFCDGYWHGKPGLTPVAG
jgi:O2-independent ubiquinone biosynthesis protein UbiV